MIREARKRAGLTQKELGERVFPGTRAPGQFISNIERGVSGIPINAVQAFSNVLDIPINRLFDLILERKERRR